MSQRLPRWPSTRSGDPYADGVSRHRPRAGAAGPGVSPLEACWTTGGGAVLRGEEARDARVSDELRAALQEWTDVADTVLRSGDTRDLDLLRRRGRQLASRVADVVGHPVEFVDPVSGLVEAIRVGDGPGR